MDDAQLDSMNENIAVEFLDSRLDRGCAECDAEVQKYGGQIRRKHRL